MLKIRLDGIYKNPVLSGKKTSTIRLGVHNHKVGDEIEFWTEKGKFASASITGIEIKNSNEFTEKDARRDGFKSKIELLKMLGKYYSDLKGKKFTIINFRIKKGARPLTIAKRALENQDLSTSEKILCKVVVEYGSLKKAAKELGGNELEVPLKKIFHELEARLSAHAS
jgi:hypothetical protein